MGKTPSTRTGPISKASESNKLQKSASMPPYCSNRWLKRNNRYLTSRGHRCPRQTNYSTSIKHHPITTCTRPSTWSTSPNLLNQVTMRHSSHQSTHWPSQLTSLRNRWPCSHRTKEWLHQLAATINSLNSRPKTCPTRTTHTRQRLHPSDNRTHRVEPLTILSKPLQCTLTTQVTQQSSPSSSRNPGRTSTAGNWQSKSN